MISGCRELEDSSNNQLLFAIQNILKSLKPFGIIGDVVGSGKTFSVLGLIAMTILKRNFLQSLFL